MLKLKTLELHNYLSIDDAKLDLENRGVILIEGKNISNNAYQSNGAGKSSLLSGVTYALYGKTVEGVSGDGVINRQAGTDCHVFLTMDRDGVLYRIERYRKGKNHNANKVRLFANDKEITTSKAALTNVKIEELLGIDFGTYVNTIAYGQGDEPVFSQATDKGKKEILENLANIGVYEKAQAVAKQKLSEEQLQLTTLKAKSASLENSITLISQYKQQAEQQVAAQKAEKAKDKKDAKDLNDLIQDSITKEAGHKMTWEKAQQKRSEYQATNPIPQASDLSKLVSDLSSKQYTAQYNANDAQAKIKKSLADLKSAAAATNCPLCGAPLDANLRAQEVARLKNEIAQLANTYKTSKATADSYTPQLKDSQDKLNAVDTKARAVYSQLQSLQGSESAAQRAYEQQANSTKLMQTRLESLVNKSYASIKTDYDGDMDKIKTELSQIDDKIAEHDTMSDNYQQLVDKVFSRKGVSSMALDLVVPFLNEHTNHYLAKLSGSILRVNMSTQTLNSDKSLSDKFDIQVQNDSGANSYQQCSTGEKKRIDIAIAFAIQDLQNSKSNMATNIAIYDECFDGLDAIGSETVIELLKEKSKSVGSIFVITHNDTLKPFFDSVITVEKGAEGISHVIGGEAVEN